MTTHFPEEIILQALNYCLERQLYCAADCLDVAGWLEQGKVDQKEFSETVSLPDWMKVKAEKRDPAVAYLHLTGGGGR
jgi:hypothetical protein